MASAIFYPAIHELTFCVYVHGNDSISFLLSTAKVMCLFKLLKNINFVYNRFCNIVGKPTKGFGRRDVLLFQRCPLNTTEDAPASA